MGKLLIAPLLVLPLHLLMAVDPCNCRQPKNSESQPLRGGIAYFSELRPTNDTDRAGFPRHCPATVPLCQGEAEELRVAAADHMQVQSFSLGPAQDRALKDSEVLVFGSGIDMGGRIPELVIFAIGSARPTRSAYIEKLHPRNGQSIATWDARKFRVETRTRSLRDVALLIAFSGSRHALLPLVWDARSSSYHFRIWSDDMFRGSICFHRTDGRQAEIHRNGIEFLQKSNEISISKRELMKGRWQVCIYRSAAVPSLPESATDSPKAKQKGLLPYFEFEVEVP